MFGNCVPDCDPVDGRVGPGGLRPRPPLRTELDSFASRGSSLLLRHPSTSVVLQFRAPLASSTP